jgi:hypothetical protein
MIDKNGSNQNELYDIRQKSVFEDMRINVLNTLLAFEQIISAECNNGIQNISNKSLYNTCEALLSCVTVFAPKHMPLTCMISLMRAYILSVSMCMATYLQYMCHIDITETDHRPAFLQAFDAG